MSKLVPVRAPGAPRLRILSPYNKSNHAAWLKNVQIYEELADDVAKHWRKNLPAMRRIARELLWTWRLFRLSKKYDVILTGSDRVGLFFAVAQQIFRRRRVSHVFLDFLINISGGKFERTIRKFFYRLAVSGASYALVQRTCEVEAYSRLLNLPAFRFCFVAYHATTFETAVEVRDDNYIFAGGDSDRDYPLLIEAVRKLPYRVIIAALRRDHFANIKVPENVEIVTVKGAQFLDLVAHASLDVVPLKKLPQHVGGEQTYINAMTMGKATIVTDLNANDYIENGKTGILTPAGDVAALRQAIQKVMEDHAFAHALERSAKEASAKFAPERFFEAVFKLCDACVASRPSQNKQSSKPDPPVAAWR